MTPQVFIFIGRSGCGKGTQATLLMEEIKKREPAREVLYLQTGALIREFIKEENYSARRAKEIYDAGDRQPDFLAVNMWSNFLFKRFTGKEIIIADGTPRSLDEARMLDTALDWMYGIKNPAVMYLNVSDNWSIKRLLARGRMDDNEEDIRERLQWFETDVLPAVEWYRNNKYYTFFDINGERNIEEIHREMTDKIFNF
ncbi:MAG: nucleoside monophosphate kinase [Candidatus Lloydbacteria bacterium]|nr:nucleoside monophosphate kinase [Candidatus Lloydbacteria bacterium]